VVVTIYNEARAIAELAARLRAALEGTGRSWEVVFVDDGSRDGSRELLRAEYARDPRQRVLLLKRNAGQHPAMAAGMQAARGGIVVTMDGDLQNDPVDLPLLLEAVEQPGVEVASGRRTGRADSLGRRLPSRLINAMLRRLTGVHIADYGCAYNAYRRAAFEPVLHAIGRQKFTKALVLSTGAPVVEVDLLHHARGERSRYSAFRLVRMALQVLTGYWPQAIQWAGAILGLVCGLAALAVSTYGLGFWIAEGNFPGLTFLAALVLGVLAVQGAVLGLLGEYVMRIQRDVERRPLYVIDEVLG
jgi:undecaprenyl-phosphate 4-deoxy-4-formamido-L-arabinose transferase